MTSPHNSSLLLPIMESVVLLHSICIVPTTHRFCYPLWNQLYFHMAFVSYDFSPLLFASATHNGISCTSTWHLYRACRSINYGIRGLGIEFTVKSGRLDEFLILKISVTILYCTVERDTFYLRRSSISPHTGMVARR